MQGVVAEQNTRLAGPMFDIIQRYEEDLGEETTGMLFCSLLDMLLDGAPSSSNQYTLGGLSDLKLAGDLRWCATGKCSCTESVPPA